MDNKQIVKQFIENLFVDNDKAYNIIDELHKIGNLIIVYGSLQNENEALKLEEKITKILKDLK